MQPAARVGDDHKCPIGPHVGGPAIGGFPKVEIENKAALRVTDALTCNGPPDAVAKGSATVMIGNQPAARVGDPTLHGGVITKGASKTFIGG